MGVESGNDLNNKRSEGADQANEKRSNASSTANELGAEGWQNLPDRASGEYLKATIDSSDDSNHQVILGAKSTQASLQTTATRSKTAQAFQADDERPITEKVRHSRSGPGAVSLSTEFDTRPSLKERANTRQRLVEQVLQDQRPNSGETTLASSLKSSGATKRGAIRLKQNHQDSSSKPGAHAIPGMNAKSDDDKSDESDNYSDNSNPPAQPPSHAERTAITNDALQGRAPGVEHVNLARISHGSLTEATEEGRQGGNREPSDSSPAPVNEVPIAAIVNDVSVHVKAHEVDPHDSCWDKRALFMLGAAFVIIIVVVVVTAIVVVGNSSGGGDDRAAPIVVLPPTNPSTSSPTASPTNAPTLPASCAKNRCGFSWVEANNKCGVACTLETESIVCLGGQKCFADLSTTLDCCDDESAGEPMPSTEGAAGCSAIRCGASWSDANSKCGQECVLDQCPNGEACYADLSTTLGCCNSSRDGEEPDMATPPASTDSGGCSTTRCGLSWVVANNGCGTACATDQDCTSGESCYADLGTSLDCCRQEAVSPTPTNVISTNPTTTSPGTCSSSRCGVSWVEANNACGIACAADEDCTLAGESCFADLNIELDCCSSGSAGDVSFSEGCSSSHCGVTWAEANNACGNSCSADQDCPANESCFTDLGTTLACCEPRLPRNDVCSTSRCGDSFDQANERCGDECLVDDDCSGRQRCFTDLSTNLDCCLEEVEEEEVNGNARHRHLRLGGSNRRRQG